MLSFAASHTQGKNAVDKIFDAVAAANKAAASFGKENVVNAAPGTLLDDNEKIVCLPTVERIYRNLPISEVVSYAPIAGLPDFLEAAAGVTFRENRPEAFIKAVATAGGTGALHNTICNYSEVGDTVLSTDWCWGPYRALCEGALRRFATFPLLTEEHTFNLPAMAEKIQQLLTSQDSLILILNTPAHNPTGYSLSVKEWEEVLTCLHSVTVTGNKRIVLVVDVAYLDYAGDADRSRAFLQKFSGLSENILTILTFSMSKGYTMYGQRVGAMIGLSSSRKVIAEFDNVNQYTCRATWSNINRGAMRVLATIYQDKALLGQVDAERRPYGAMVKERADIFTREAKAAGMSMLPFTAGFFLTIPCRQPDRTCDLLKQDNIFAVPLARGVRISVCAVPQAKITGIAGKLAKAIAKTEEQVH